MPLTGALTADFGDFVNEANKASAALGVMEAEGKKAGLTLAKTGQQVDGFGKDNTLSVIAKELRTVDQTMGALGFSIGPVVGAIGELGTVVARAGTSLSLLEKSSLILAAAFAAWQVGKWIYDIAGLDKAFADLSATMQGKVAPSFQTWQQRLELGRGAILKGFTGDIMDTAAAMNFLSNKADENAAALNTSAERVRQWTADLNDAATAPHLKQIAADLASQNSTHDQLSKKYLVSTDALQYYSRELAKTAKATKEQADADKKAADEATRLAAAQDKLRASMFGTDTITKANEYVAALGGIGNLTKMTAEEQAKLNTVVGDAIAAYKRMGDTAPPALNAIYTATASIGPVTTGLGAEWANVGTKVTTTVDHIVADIQRMKGETEAYEAETLRQMEASWKKVPPPVDDTTEAVERLSVALSSATHQTESLFEKLQAGKALFEAYQQAGVATGTQIGLDPYNFKNQQKTLLPTMSSTGNTLNVNVNSTEAGNISTALVNEMRRQGVRF